MPQFPAQLTPASPGAAAVTLLFTLALASVHIFAGRLVAQLYSTEEGWVAVASGVSVGYVVASLMPEVSHIAVLGEEDPLFRAAIFTELVYLVVLLGLLFFYGLSLVLSRTPEGPVHRPRFGYATALGALAAYNLVVGVLLVVNTQESTVTGALYTLAMVMHLLVMDHSFREYEPHAYRRRGRWLLVAGLVLGVGFGLAAFVSAALFALLFAFVGGGILLSAFREVLGGETTPEFLRFSVSALGYAAILLLI